jgi:hypothetical protein
MKAKYIPYIIIGILLVVIFFLRECTPKPKPCPPPSIVTTIDTQYIPVDHYYPVPYPVVTIDTFEVPSIVDTAKILADYFKLRIYERKIGNDSIGYCTLTDSVTKNKLRGSHLKGTWKTYTKTTTITNDITIPLRNRVFLGMQIGSDLNSMMIIPTATLLTKKDKTTYSVGYDPFSKVGYIGIQFKITLKK